TRHLSGPRVSGRLVSVSTEHIFIFYSNGWTAAKKAVVPGQESSEIIRATGKEKARKKAWAPAIFAIIAIGSAHAEEGSDTDVELANKLSNPISSLISVPF